MRLDEAFAGTLVVKDAFAPGRSTGPGRPAMSALLRKLSEAIGVSGREDEVRAILVEEIRGKADSARVDALGNLVAIRRGTGASKLRVMIAAHMDEVGLMVTQVEDGGMLRFARVGGIDERVLPARPVTVGAKRVPGVIAFKPVHLTEKGETDRVAPAKDLVIDIGATSKAEAERLVARGDHACFLSEYVEPLADPRGGPCRARPSTTGPAAPSPWPCSPNGSRSTSSSPSRCRRRSASAARRWPRSPSDRTAPSRSIARGRTRCP